MFYLWVTTALLSRRPVGGGSVDLGVTATPVPQLRVLHSFRWLYTLNIMYKSVRISKCPARLVFYPWRAPSHATSLWIICQFKNKSMSKHLLNYLWGCLNPLMHGRFYRPKIFQDTQIRQKKNNTNPYNTESKEGKNTRIRLHRTGQKPAKNCIVNLMVDVVNRRVTGWIIIFLHNKLIKYLFTQDTNFICKKCDLPITIYRFYPF